MIPEDRFSIRPVRGSLVNPWDRKATVSKHWGPVAIQDTSEGLLALLWQARIDGNKILLSAPGITEIVGYTHTHTLTEVSLAFNQNGDPYYSFVDEEGDAYFRWYDGTLPGMTTTLMEAGTINPRMTLDDARPFNISSSDVILGYVKDGLLRYRQQRDSFSIEHTPTVGVGGPVVETDKLLHISMNSKLRLQFLMDDSQPLPRTSPGHAFEIDRGWSFDGNYIPHFAELNWYFGDNPVDFTGVQKIRVHGLSKGRSLLQVATNGMEPEDLSYLPDYSEPQWCDLPKRPYYVSKDYVNVTNYTDTANRGLSIQMKFEGRNTDITKPEPSHVLQVLVLQASPQGTGARGN